MGQNGEYNLLDKYLEYTSDSEAPEIFHKWCFLTVFGHLFKKKVYLDMGYFRLYPGQLFVFLVGPPGVKKSSAIKIASDLISDFKDVHKISGKLSTQALIDSLEAKPIINGTQLTTSDSIALIEAGELANFIPKQSYIEEIIPFLTDAFDARDDDWTYSTRYKGDVTLRNTLLTFFAGTTEDWLFKNIPDSAWGGGFMSRVILINQPSCEREVAIPKISPLARRQKREILAEMYWICNRLHGEFFWTKEARNWYTKWYSSFRQTATSKAISTTLANYMARKPVHILKIAMTLSIIQTRTLVLTEACLKAAERIFVDLEIFLPDLLDRKTASNPVAEQCQNVLDYLRDRSNHRKSDLLRALWRKGLNAAALDIVLETLLQAELIEVAQIGKNFYYRLK